jgi:hypothetical protein
LGPRSGPVHIDEVVQIVVDASGHVTAATASGPDPTFGQCIANEMRRWTFHGAGVVNIPFFYYSRPEGD